MNLSKNIPVLVALLLALVVPQSACAHLGLRLPSAQGTHVLVDVGVITNNHTFTVRDNTTGIILGVTAHGTSTSAGLVSIALSPVPHNTSLSLSIECTDPTGGDLYCNGIVLPRDTLTAINIHGNVCSADAYQYGYNGQMKDNEWAGLGNHTSAKFWEYDTRVGRRWNIDPVYKPWHSPYDVFDNNPVWKMDKLGDDDYTVNKKGEISLLNKTEDKKDKLYYVGKNGKVQHNKKGEILSPNISLSKGILSEITNFTKEKYSKDGWRLDFGDKAEEAKKTFSFLADYTSVEYTLLHYEAKDDNKNQKNSIYTSHNSGEEYFGGNRASELASNKSVIANLQYTHNHPRTSQEQSHYGRPSDKRSNDGQEADQEIFNKIWRKMFDAKIFIREKGETYPVPH